MKLHATSYYGYYKNYHVRITEDKMHHWVLNIESAISNSTQYYLCYTLKEAREYAIKIIDNIGVE